MRDFDQNILFQGDFVGFILMINLGYTFSQIYNQTVLPLIHTFLIKSRLVHTGKVLF